MTDAANICGDFILLDAGGYWGSAGEPFMADGTKAVLLHKGSVDMSIDMRDYHIESPCLVMVLDGMVIRHQDRSQDAVMDVIALSGRFTDSLFSDTRVASPLKAAVMADPVFPLEGGAEVLDAFCVLARKLADASSSGPRLDAARSLLMTLLQGFTVDRDKAPQAAASRKDDLAAQFAELVRSNYRSEHSVVWYADRLSLTPKYLSQTVKDSTGRPPMQWIEDYVVTESKALLRSTTLTIDQISTRLNFASASLFGKFFHRLTGESPRAFRNRQIQQQIKTV